MLDRTQFYRFETFVRDTAEAHTGEELFALLQRATGQYGYDRLIFSAPLDLDLPPDLNRWALYTSYPDDWSQEYAEKDYARIDPVLRAAGSFNHAFTWDGLERMSQFTDAQKRFMQDAAAAGLHNGIGVPIRGHRTLLAGVGLASSQPHNDAEAHRDLINAICNQFYMAFRRLYARPRTQDLDVTALSRKEREILSWVAAGKTDDDIATILSISRNTVDTHMRAIFRKLDAANRVTAVVRGIMYGHIFL